MISHAGRLNRPLSVLLLCLVCSVALITGGVGVETVTAQETTINASIDGDRLVHDGEITVVEDPTANISVTAETPVNLVEIRIDGEIRHSYRPNSTAFSQTIPLELDPNENTLEIIARNDGVTSFKTTVKKNTAAPRVRYSSPFSTSIKGGPSNETNLSTGQVTLAGSLHTVSTVERIRVEQTHISEENNNSTQVNRQLYTIRNPGDSFSQDLLLGIGTNEIVAEYTDANGRTNTDKFRLIVDDATDPTVDLNVPTSSHTNAVRIRGTVRDETKLSRVAVNRTSNNASQVLLLSSNDKPDPNRLTYEIDTTVELYSENDDNEFRLVAEDAAGNVRTQTFSIEYDPEPKVVITENSTNETAKTVRVAGNISEAEINRVTVETIDTQSGDRLDLARVYEAGTPTTAVEFDQTLRAMPEKTVIKLLIEYEYGQEVRMITPSVPAQQEADENERGDSPSSSDAVTDGKTDSESSAVDSDNTSVDENETGNNTTPREGDSSTDDTPSSPAFVPIRARDAFGGTVIVGAVYILGHWV